MKYPKTTPASRIKCGKCGYCNHKDYVKYSGVCHLCGNILDDKAYFKQQMNIKMRLWRGKRMDKWNVKGKWD